MGKVIKMHKCPRCGKRVERLEVYFIPSRGTHKVCKDCLKELSNGKGEK